MKIDDKTIKLRIWDTAGQEKYRSIGKAYYRNAIGIILVFALNDVKSFESISLWLQKVQQYCHPNAKFLLVGNKNDLMIERYVSQEKIEEFVHKHNLDYCEASAKADFNITNCFNILTQKVYQAVINHEIIIQEPNNENIGQKKYSNDKCKC
ncbi:small GTP-binding protein [Tritrichomonas foetus]|uniref:Small GTP-binding protein n=1 Tax=Tritrichomonas foetus TaxID=1144522 RepID=A0A1J4KD21_9EUKA|nr:small GTP-binding protein [Tritrichomonas foetus]|eukprot:OHT09115.1 small GTP-binding protein [Tritrichomonas foetus]